MKSPIFGVDFETDPREALLGRVETRLSNGQITRICTPNPLILQRAKTDPALFSALRTAELCLADGVGVRMAARLLRAPLPTRIAGIEFAEDLLALAEQKGWRVFLLGGKPTVADKAASKLRGRFPKLRICGACHGYFDEGYADTLADHIRSKRPDLLFVCLGSPKQELFLHQCLEKTGARLGIGLGGSLDVWSGNTGRAPLFFRRMGLEWLWRMAREPHRLLGLPKIAVFLLSACAERRKEAVKLHRKSKKN